MESPIGTHHEDFEVFATPSKSGSDRLTPSKRSGNEENEHNGMHPTNDRQMKRMKTTFAPTRQDPPGVVEERGDRESYDCGGSIPKPAPSDCASDFSSSSTSALKRSPHTKAGFHAQPQRSVFRTPHKTTFKTPGRAPGSASSTAASVLVQRLVENKHPQGPKASLAFTPGRGKAKIKKAAVQATNDGYASVAKLSAWLADDPTSTKKVRHIRKGRNVIAKSRQFEEDMEGVIIEETQMTKGAVSDKKQWLKGAFHGGKEGEFIPPAPRYAKSEVGGYRAAAVRRTPGGSSARSEIVTDDTASSLSVSDKKAWLKNAFNTSGTTPVKNVSMPAVARSDIMHCRGERRDDISARAKSKWTERSARRLAEKQEMEAITMSPTKANTHNEQQKGGPRSPTPTPDRASAAPKEPMPAARAAMTHNKQMGAPCSPTRIPIRASAVPEQKMDVTRTAATQSGQRTGAPGSHTPSQASVAATQPTAIARMPTAHNEQRTGPPPSPSRNLTSAAPPQRTTITSSVTVEEDTTDLGFAAARKLLIKRSQLNGNELKVISKVQRRKEKFEKMEQETRRRSGPKGLLRPSWGAATPSKGRPSDAYTKSYVEDIAPKRSFEELP